MELGFENPASAPPSPFLSYSDDINQTELKYLSEDVLIDFTSEEPFLTALLSPEDSSIRSSPSSSSFDELPSDEGRPIKDVEEAVLSVELGLQELRKQEQHIYASIERPPRNRTNGSAIPSMQSRKPDSHEAEYQPPTKARRTAPDLVLNVTVDRWDEALGVSNILFHLAEVYKEYLWPGMPLHPAVFDESNLRYYLINPPPEGSAESYTSCAIASSVVISFGAALTNNEALRLEYANKAFQRMAALSAYPNVFKDYSFAMVAYAMACYHGIWGDAKVANNFRQLAMTICREMDALNSVIYSRCLIVFACSMELTPENMSALQNEIQQAREKPYHGVTTDVLPNMAKEMLEQDYIQELPLGINRMKYCSESMRKGALCVSALRLFQQNQPKLPPPQPNNGNKETRLLPMIQDLLEGVVAWEVAMTRESAMILDDNNRWPKQYLFAAKFIFFAIKAELYRLSGDLGVAIQYAVSFLKECEEIGPSYYYVVGLIPYYADMIFRFFVDVGLWGELKRLADTLMSWSGSNPKLAILCKNYLALSIERQRNLQQQQQHQQQLEASLPVSPTLSLTTTTTAATTPDAANGGKRKRGRPPLKRKVVIAPMKPAPTFKPQQQQPLPRLPPQGQHPQQLQQHRTLVPLHQQHHPQQQLQQQQPQQPPMQHQPGAAYSAPARLGVTQLMAQCDGYLSYFRKHVWTFSPLHPAVLDSSNIEYFMDAEGREEATPLALSFYVALCRGASLSGHLGPSMDFFGRAESILTRLLNRPQQQWRRDYSIALSAVNMAFIIQEWYPLIIGQQQPQQPQQQQQTMRHSKLQRYLSIGLEICNTLKAYNSDVYMRLIFIASLENALQPVPLPPSFTSLLVQPLLSGDGSAPSGARGSEYHPITEGILRVAEYHNSNSGGKERCFSQLQSITPMSRKNLQRLTSVYRAWSAVLMCIDSADTGPQSLDAVYQLVEEVKAEQRLSDDLWPRSVERLHEFFMSVMKARYAIAVAGNTQQGWYYIQRAIVLSEKKKCRFLFPGIPLLLQELWRLLLLLPAINNQGEGACNPMEEEQEKMNREWTARLMVTMKKWTPAFPVVEKMTMGRQALVG